MLVRALIVLFLVLNLGVAAWWIAHDPPPPAPVQVPPGVVQLQLVEETRAPEPEPAPSAPAAATASTSTSTAAPATTPPPVADATTAPPAQQCFGFGPFASKEAGTAAAARLRPLVQKLTTREQATPSPGRGWRVYLPPLSSREEAQAVAQRIGAAGFSDFLVMREGADANAIALGRYSSQDAANKRVQALTAAGFAARAEALGTPAVAVWLDVVADEAFDPRRAQASIAAAQFRKLDCAAQR